MPGFQAAPGAAAPRPLLAPAVGALPGLRPTVPSGLGGLGGPRPLLLDAAGREVDEAGNVITHAARAPITTSLVSCVVAPQLDDGDTWHRAATPCS